MGQDMMQQQYGGYQSAYPTAQGTNIPQGYQQSYDPSQQASGYGYDPSQYQYDPSSGTYAQAAPAAQSTGGYASQGQQQVTGGSASATSTPPAYRLTGAATGAGYQYAGPGSQQAGTAAANATSNAPGYQMGGTSAIPQQPGYQMQGPAGQQPLGKTNQSAPQLGQQYGAQTDNAFSHITGQITDILHRPLPGAGNWRSSNSSDNWLQAIGHDALHDLGTPSGWMPQTVAQNIAKDHRAWQGQRRDARNNAQNAALNAQDDWMYKAKEDQAAKIAGYQTATDSARNSALSSINAGYANREPSYQDAYNSQLAASNANAAAQYQTGTQNEGLQMAAAGRLGSSTDAEHQADLANTYRTQVVGGQNSAQDYAQALRDSDYQQQNSLQRAALSGDPATAAGYQSMASGATSNAQNLAGKANLQQQQIGLQNQYGMAQSQQLGGLGNALAGGVQSYYGVYGGA